MSNKIESIHVAPTSESRSVPGRFETALRGAAAGLAHGIADGVQLAAPFVPGGTVLSAAVRVGAGAIAGAAAGSGTGAAAAAAAGSESELLTATRALQQQAQTFNLQYLQLQEGMQRENREFTALSNVMKVKHDSARAAIQNIH
ncbi:MAG TPA: hypothetical protein VEB43_11705 [Anaeromyxobacter sp.]|nr:hypothetical protein [Anaeromyxobacter sp.]